MNIELAEKVLTHIKEHREAFTLPRETQATKKAPCMFDGIVRFDN